LLQKDNIYLRRHRHISTSLDEPIYAVLKREEEEKIYLIQALA
jgi:hypothetical protein